MKKIIILSIITLVGFNNVHAGDYFQYKNDAEKTEIYRELYKPTNLQASQSLLVKLNIDMKKRDEGIKYAY